MKTRTKVAMLLGLAAGILFIAASVLALPMIAFAIGSFALVIVFVMSIAWMRPSGYPPEHHPPSDRIVDDTGP